MKKKFITICFVGVAIAAIAKNVVEEVAWVVGDEPIYKSEIEEQYMQMQYERMDMAGDPYCVIPEKIAIEKLFLHQAKLDSIEVSESTVSNEVENRINIFITNIGTKEKVEEYFRKPLPEIREALRESIRNQYTMQQVQQNLTKNIKATPSDVRKYYASLSEDKIPYIPKQVEVKIITINPTIPISEVEEVKSRLRDYANRVNNGETEFSTLAILYSEDQASAIYGGELGFRGKSDFVSEFSAVAFNLNDTKKVSKIVETEFGYHIIQLIEKRGDRANFRHILLRPKVAEKDIKDAIVRLDSARMEILDNKYSFEDATWFSQDKDSRANRGKMVNRKDNGDISTKFQLSELPQEVAKQVNEMKVGEISKAFTMIDKKTNRDVVAIVKLESSTEGHKANLSEDYQILKNMYESAERDRIIQEWVSKKQKDTFVRIEDGWRNCEFEYEGWVKN